MIVCGDMKKIIYAILFIICLLNSDSRAAETNVLLRSGVEYLDWSPWTHPIKKSTADIDKENYGLAKYSLDFFYDNAKLFYIDYYQFGLSCKFAYSTL